MARTDRQHLVGSRRASVRTAAPAASAGAVGVLVALAAVLACDAEIRLVQTPLQITTPDGDGAVLASIQMQVWPVDARACAELSLWRSAVCGRACTTAPTPLDRQEAPIATATLERATAGDWGDLDLPVTGSGPWDLLSVGLDASGEPVLHGCALVSSGSDTRLSMWRSWCGDGNCGADYAGVCEVTVTCVRAPTDDDPEFIDEPTCVATSTFAYAWQQDGVDCTPEQDTHFTPCRPARFSCAPGKRAPVIDGVCPRTPRTELACGARAEEDVDCDGNRPGPCGVCTPDETTACRSDRALAAPNCIGTATCGDDGQWGACVSQRETEVCDGEDNDCDSIPDDQDPDAVTTCNRARPERAPSADRCLGARRQCLCGRSPACAAGSACCGSECVDIERNGNHCGGCNQHCRGTCRNGRCNGVVIDPRPDAGLIDTGFADSGRGSDAEPTDNGRHADAEPTDDGRHADAVVDVADARPARDADPSDSGSHRDAEVADNGRHADALVAVRDTGVHPDATPTRDTGVHPDATATRDTGVHPDATPTRDTGVHPDATVDRDSGVHPDATVGRDSGVHRDAEPEDSGRHPDATLNTADSGLTVRRDASTSTTGSGRGAMDPG